MTNSEKFKVHKTLFDFLDSPPSVSLSEIVEWELLLIRELSDYTVRLVYADWLQERGCEVREKVVRTEAGRIAEWQQRRATALTQVLGPLLNNRTIFSPGEEVWVDERTLLLVDNRWPWFRLGDRIDKWEVVNYDEANRRIRFRVVE